MIAHTPEDFALAQQLYAAAIKASYPDLQMKFEALNGNQIDGWLAVAQLVQVKISCAVREQQELHAQEIGSLMTENSKLREEIQQWKGAVES
jgi:hypothetical protein